MAAVFTTPPMFQATRSSAQFSDLVLEQLAIPWDSKYVIVSEGAYLEGQGDLVSTY